MVCESTARASKASASTASPSGSTPGQRRGPWRRSRSNCGSEVSQSPPGAPRTRSTTRPSRSRARRPQGRRRAAGPAREALVADHRACAEALRRRGTCSSSARRSASAATTRSRLYPVPPRGEDVAPDRGGGGSSCCTPGGDARVRRETEATDPVAPTHSPRTSTGPGSSSQGDLQGARASRRAPLQLEATRPRRTTSSRPVAAQERVDDAMEHYHAAMALDDGYVDPFLNAAELMLHPLHDFDGAIEALRRVLEFVEGRGGGRRDALEVRRAARQGRSRTTRGACSTRFPEGFQQAAGAVLPRRPRLLPEAGAAERAEPHLLDAMRRARQPDPRYYLALVCDARRPAPPPKHMLACRSLERELPPWALPRRAFERAVASRPPGTSPELAAPSTARSWWSTTRPAWRP